jgi:hypothetical protein
MLEARLPRMSALGSSVNKPSRTFVNKGKKEEDRSLLQAPVLPKGALDRFFSVVF